MSQMMNDKFERFEANKNKLLDFFSQAQEIISPYKQTTECQQLKDASDKLAEDSFKTLVVGEFKRGKSTFINALLGEEILPAYATPCTAVINEVKFGDEPKAILHFNNPLPKELPKKLSPKVAAHINEFKSKGEIPPMEIPVDEIENYVVIPDPGKDQSKQVAETPFSLVELYWPLDLCKNNVEVIDSPGLNEHKSRTDVTNNYLSKVDAVIFVMSCDMLASESEMMVVDSLRNSGFQDIFFICNRFDQIRRQSEKDRVKKYALDKLTDKTSLKERGIHFVSSADALDAKLEITDPDELHDELDRTGFLLVEKELISFLTESRGKIKILQPGRELRRILNKMLDEVLPARKKMYEQKYEELKENYEKSKPELQKARERQQVILREVELQQQRFSKTVRDSFRIFMRDQIDMIPTWIKNHQFTHSLSFFSTEFTKDQAAKIIQECSDVVQGKLEQQIQNWQNAELRPCLEEFISDIQQRTEQDLQAFYENLTSIRRSLNLSVENDTQEIGMLERVLATAGGFLVGGAGSAMIGSTLGMNEMLKSLFPQIGLAFGLVLLGFTNPWILIPALLAGGGIQAMFSMSGQTEKIKSMVADKFQTQLRDKLTDQSDQIAEDVKAKTNELFNQINLGLNNEIKSLEDNVNAALIEMENKKGNMDAEKAKIDNDTESMKKLRNNLANLMDSII